VLGGVLGECWANTHPSSFPLYKGCPAKLGGVSVISLATIRNFIGGEMAFLLGQAAFSLSPANIFFSPANIFLSPANIFLSPASNFS